MLHLLPNAYINKTPATQGLTSQSSARIHCSALLRSNWSLVSCPLPRNADDHSTVHPCELLQIPMEFQTTSMLTLRPYKFTLEMWIKRG